MPTKFTDTTREQAEEFCAHVVAREPYRLRDLAQRMHATGGPVEAMDASVDSLVPLWEWFVRSLLSGLPGVPEDARPARAGAFIPVTVDDVQMLRRGAACEGLEHYMRLVIERLYGQAPWAVLDDRRSFYHHETLVRLPAGFFRTANIATLASNAQADRRSHRSPKALREHLLMMLEASAPEQSVGESVLVPYLTADLPPMREIARVSPMVRWESGGAEPAVRAAARVPATPRVGDELVFVAGTGEDLNDRPHKVRPLPVDVVAAALTTAGFTSDDADHVVPEHLLEDDIHLMHREEVAVVGTFVHGGRLRALFFEPYGGTQAQWDAMEIQLRHLAETLGARLAPEDQLD